MSRRAVSCRLGRPPPCLWDKFFDILVFPRVEAGFGAGALMIEQRVAVVTGAAAGIGQAIAKRLAQDGHRVAIADRNGAAGVAAARDIGGSAFFVGVDVSDPDSVAQMVKSVVGQTGRLDILVNNAGIAGIAAPVINYPIEDWRRVHSVNLDGVFYCCRAAVPHMLDRRWGRVVNVASIAGKEGNPHMSAYSSAKAGVMAFTKALAKELATSGVLVNCITPAVIRTQILTQLTPEAVDYMISRIPMRRTGKPEEAAALVSWLVSDECSFSTGAVFDLSGGRATY